MSSSKNFVAHTIPIVWTPATTASTALTAFVGIEGRVWGMEITGLRWGETWTPITAGSSACSSARVTIYSPLGTVLACSTTIPSADPYTAAPCAQFFGVGASASTILVTNKSYIRYTANGDDNQDNPTDANTARVVSGADIPATMLPRATVVLYVET